MQVTKQECLDKTSILDIGGSDTRWRRICRLKLFGSQNLSTFHILDPHVLNIVWLFRVHDMIDDGFDTARAIKCHGGQVLFGRSIGIDRIRVLEFNVTDSFVDINLDSSS